MMAGVGVTFSTGARGGGGVGLAGRGGLVGAG